MIKYENATRESDFKKMAEKNIYQIQKHDDFLEIQWNLYSEPYIYRLRRIGTDEFVFCSTNGDLFSCNFLSKNNTITILHGEKNGRKYKSEKTLKQFMRIVCLANSVLQHIEYKL